MNEDLTNLDRLNDLALPPEVAYLPPAPGWYVVMAVLVCAGLWLAWRAWKNWQANAYRRAAIDQLTAASSVAAISEVLRRTALAVVPRSAIAGLSGAAWPDWLSKHCPEPLPESAKQQLVTGVYGVSDSVNQTNDMNSLRDYAAVWIRKHQVHSDEGDC